MAWMDRPTATIETKFGTIRLAVLRHGEVYVDASSNGKFLTYRGKNYPFSENLGFVGGKWERQRDERGHQFSLYCDAPKTYAAALEAEVVACVTSFMARNPGIRVEAQKAYVNNELDSIHEKMEELKKETLKLQVKAAKLEASLAGF